MSDADVTQDLEDGAGAVDSTAGEAAPAAEPLMPEPTAPEAPNDGLPVADTVPDDAITAPAADAVPDDAIAAAVGDETSATDGPSAGSEDVVAVEPPGPPPPSAEELAAIAASAPTPTAEELAALAAAAEAALPIADVVTPASQAAADAAALPAKPATPVPTRRRRLRGWTWRLATSLFSLALFIGGVALGSTVYQRVQPPPPVVGDPSTGGVQTPPVVKELADALASNDADSLRSAVSGDPYRLLTGELQSWDLQGVTSVETLATMQDGTRSATEIVITGRSPSGDPRVFNLVVHVDDNQIVNFR